MQCVNALRVIFQPVSNYLRNGNRCANVFLVNGVRIVGVVGRDRRRRFRVIIRLVRLVVRYRRQLLPFAIYNLCYKYVRIDWNNRMMLLQECLCKVVIVSCFRLISQRFNVWWLRNQYKNGTIFCHQYNVRDSMFRHLWCHLHKRNKLLSKYINIHI